MQFLTALLIASMGITDSYTTPSPCTVSSTWTDQVNNNCNAYQTKSWCVSEFESQFQLEAMRVYLTPTLPLYPQNNGMVTAGWDATGGGQYGYSIEAGATNGVDAYSACCYCMWGGAPTPRSITYFVSLSGKDSNSCTSPNLACRTIKSALSKAKTIVATDITIKVAEGE